MTSSKEFIKELKQQRKRTNEKYFKYNEGKITTVCVNCKKTREVKQDNYLEFEVSKCPECNWNVVTVIEGGK